MTTQNSDLISRRAAKAVWYDRIDDPDLRVELERIEDRIYSYADDMLDGWLGMAHEFAAAKPRLIKERKWTEWVEDRFSGFIGRESADKLAEIGQLERSELAALRNTYFQKGTGIKAIAAYLAAPEQVQEQVKQGEVQPNAADITRAIAAAEEAQKRAEERERAARLAEATVQEQVEQIRHEAQLQGELAVQQATARLQRDLDEARHQASLRQRDMEEAQQQIKRAQAEWNERLTYAKKEERERIEADFTKQMRTLENQLREQEKLARTAQKQAKDLNDRLTHARDSDAIRARWDALADAILTQCDLWLQNLPSVIDAQYFENHERTLVDIVRKRAETLASRMTELGRGSMTVVESD